MADLSSSTKAWSVARPMPKVCELYEVPARSSGAVYDPVLDKRIQDVFIGEAFWRQRAKVRCGCCSNLNSKSFCTGFLFLTSQPVASDLMAYRYATMDQHCGLSTCLAGCTLLLQQPPGQPHGGCFIPMRLSYCRCQMVEMLHVEHDSITP